MVGRKPKPTKLKMLIGNPGKRKLNDSEPVSEVVCPDPPEHLSAEAKGAWVSFAKSLHDSQILTTLDLSSLELVCVTYARWRKAAAELDRWLTEDKPKVSGGLLVFSATSGVTANPLIRIESNLADLLRKLLVEFGMTPSARSRVHAEGGKAKVDPTEKYFKKKA